MTIEEQALQNQRQKNNEFVSQLILVMESIKISCYAFDNCKDCKLCKNNRRGCLFDLGKPYDWDDVTLAAFRLGIERAFEQTLTKGDTQ